jgi:hypothetical protein
VRNRITATAVAAAASLALLGGSAQAFAADAAPAAPSQLTVGAYKTWLKKSPGAEAKDTLRAFNRLTPAQQRKFVGYLQDPKVLKAFVVAHSGKIPSLSYATTVKYKNDITFTTRTSAGAPGEKDQRTITLTTRSVERIFNIPVTEFASVLTYETKADKITGKGWKTKSFGSNQNAAFAFKPSKSRAVLKGNSLSGVTNWTATPQYKSAGTAPIKKFQAVTGNGARTHHAQIGNGTR